VGPPPRVSAAPPRRLPLPSGSSFRTPSTRLKRIGIGAGAGLIIGKLLKQDLIVGGLLGAAAGYLYDEITMDKAQPKDVVVQPGTVFGVRMDRIVRYNAPEAFVTARRNYRNTN